MAGVNPKETVSERLTYVTRERLKLVVGVSEEFKSKLKRAQDLVSNSLLSAASLEQTLEAALDLFLEKRDPLQKAQRAAMKYTKHEAGTDTNAPVANTVAADTEATEVNTGAAATNQNAALQPVPLEFSILTQHLAIFDLVGLALN